MTWLRSRMRAGWNAYKRHWAMGWTQTCRVGLALREHNLKRLALEIVWLLAWMVLQVALPAALIATTWYLSSTGQWYGVCVIWGAVIFFGLFSDKYDAYMHRRPQP